ncbi:MAG: tilS [Schlesneria sp.]|nr:tilS [Schlesneria sp.]
MTASSLFLNELRRGLERCQIPSTSILIGVSGGADSVALLLGLVQVRDEYTLSLTVGHLNHQLRGDASDADAEWVRLLCDRLQVPIEIGISANLPQNRGLEEAARDARHSFLDRTALALHCEVIATAHTADDQAETVLHHIFRGTGLSGVRGIPETRLTPSARRLVRPLLAIRRELIERYLAELGQDFRTDATNADTSLTRNWLRHTLLPDLRTQFGPQVDLSLNRLAEQAADVEQTLNILAEHLLNQAVLDCQPNSVRLNTRLFADQPLHLIRESFRLLWRRQQWPLQSMGFTEWNRVADVALTTGNINLPGKLRLRHHPPGLLVIEKTDR